MARMKDQLRRSQQAGYTLLEAIVVSAIFSIVFIGILSTFITNYAVYNKGEVRSNLQQNARLALEQMSTEIRQAGFFPENFGMYTPANPPLWPNCGALASAARPIWVATEGDANSDGTLVIYGDVDPNITPRPPVPPAPAGTTCSNFVRYNVVTLGGPPPTTAVLCRAFNDANNANASWATGCTSNVTPAMAPLVSLPITANVPTPIRLRFAFYDSCDQPLLGTLEANVGRKLDNIKLGGAKPADPVLFTATCPAVPGAGQERAAVRRVLITLTLREDVPGQGVQVYTLTTDIRLRNMPSS